MSTSSSGLVDDTWQDEDDDEVFVQVKLEPNDLVFYPPWEGVYDT